TILHSPYDRRQSGNYEIVGGHRPPLQSPSRTLLLAMWLLIGPALVAAQGLDPASLLKPLSDSWPTYSGDYSGRRYSSLIQINQSNVKNLTLAWTHRLINGPTPGGQQGAAGTSLIIGGEGPGDIVAAGATQVKGAVLQVNGVLYVTTPD